MNTIQYNTIQYNTIRYDTIRYNTTLLILHGNYRGMGENVKHTMDGWVGEDVQEPVPYETWVVAALRCAVVVPQGLQCVLPVCQAQDVVGQVSGYMMCCYLCVCLCLTQDEMDQVEGQESGYMMRCYLCVCLSDPG